MLRFAALAVLVALAVAADRPAEGQPVAAPPTDFAPFLKAHCVACHGPKKQEGKVRLDALPHPSVANKDQLALWASAFEQIDGGQMPPEGAPKIAADELARAKAALRAELTRAGAPPAGASAAEFPNKGNLVDHDALFNRPLPPGLAAPATPARVWRLSPFAYREFVDDLTHGRLIVKGGPAVLAKRIPLATDPFGLTGDPGFRDYAFRYQVSGSESQQLAANARIVVAGLIAKRPRYAPPKALSAIADTTAKPSAAQVRAAVAHTFGALLYRAPTADELDRHAEFLAARVERLGNREGLIHGLVPVFLHPEAVFRSELGAGPPDAHGRLKLAPTELAVALAYALTDSRPDGALLAAARGGKLATAHDGRREVTRLLNDSYTDKPRVLRFFQEYFDYYRAPDVFKDPQDVKRAGIGGKYNADPLVTDTDRLVLHVLASDRDVLKQLLTTDRSFVGYEAAHRRGGGGAKRDAPHPFGARPGQNELYKHYNFDLAKWSDKMPLALPADQRAGVLTQPAWLIAHSANDETHAIHRGKWVRERLLGGTVPDTPVTVEAKLPDEPNHTLRHRMRVTREAYCLKCHKYMDPLGLPFESYDHLGQFRTTELGKPVDTSGEVIAGGDAQLDGKVASALELVRRLAASARVEQVFVRHAFRYWMGRNETLEDAPTLRAAHAAYARSGGSMNALIVALLTSDSFLYRRPVAVR